MAKKKVKTQIKLQIPAGSANPAPPVGPALGQHGVNIMDFCNQFNAKTKTTEAGMIIPAVITIYADRSFSFILKMPPVSALLKKAVGLAKASGEPNKTKVGKITKKQAEEIAKQKLPDLNTDDITSAVRIVEGTARSMGIEIGDQASSTKTGEASPASPALRVGQDGQDGGGKLEQKNS